MNSFRHLSARAVATATLLVCGPTLFAQNGDEQSATYRFTDPAKPGVVRIALGMRDLIVTGADTDTVSMATDLRSTTAKPRADGLRVLSDAASVTVTEKDNLLVIDAGFDSGPGNPVNLTVPRTTSVIITNSLSGAVSIAGINGDIEIKCLNGKVTLREVSGSALVETMNGAIDARIAALQEGKPLSFTSMNGTIALTLPAEAKANVRLRTQHGAIMTDFDETALVTRTESLRGYRYTVTSGSNDEIRETVREAVRIGMEAAREAAEAMREAAHAAREAAREARTENATTPRAPRAPLPPLPPMTGGKLVSGTLNGGGSTDISATAMNGDVKLRRAD
jgi:DNA-binding NarL/FixJ family response regulator